VKILAYDHLTAQYGTERSRLSASGFQVDRPLQALLADLCRVPDAEVALLRDASFVPLNLPAAVRVVPCDAGHAAEALAACMEDADAVWPVAPESAGILERASRHILDCDRLLIGSHPEAIRVFASKHRSSRILKAAGLPVVDTWRLDEAAPESRGAWVVKPDDGAGCSETRIFPDRDAARAWIGERDPGLYVMQPYIHGKPSSISLVCADGRVLMMSVNEQRMAVANNQLHAMGSTVSGVRDQQRQYRALAERVIATVPGLWGYVGIDFIASVDGPVVLELNPRVTISHAGMRPSLGHNPAQLLIELLQSGYCTPFESRRIKPVSIDITAFPEQPARHKS
jgi:predicted ATP-grasp superfamily ATP-dependent carboligase